MSRNLRFGVPMGLLAVLLALLITPSPALSTGTERESLTVGERITLQSRALGEERTILVGLPKGYEKSGTRYPVVYVLDGEFFFHQMYAAVQFLAECTYIRTHPIPQLIVVGIINVDRNRDYTPTHAPVQGPLWYPTSGGGDRFLQFLETELIPFVDRNFRTEPYRILSGWSFGGLFTVDTFLEKPTAFSAYLAISPSLWWEQDLLLGRFKTLLDKESLSRKPLVVTLGADEGGDMDRSARQGLFPLLQAGQRKDLALTAIEIPAEEHYYSPYKAVYEGLLALYADWVIPEDLVSGGLDSVQAFYDDLSAKYGYQIDIPASAYQALVGSLLRQDKEKEALEIARLAVERYPDSSRAHRTLGVVIKHTGDLDAARRKFAEALEVERGLDEPDSERMMDIRLQLWLLDREAYAVSAGDG